ncbi:MAG: efflux RND transporter permease subunit, partial [Holophagales bacterium]|nr:efflux RND transporter permease subunit [Holophagales bacterium]
LGEILGSGGAQLSLGVVANEAIGALQAAEVLAEELGRVEGLRDLQMDRVRGTENVVIRLDREEIVRRRLDPDLVARELRAQIAGIEATFFNEVDQRIDIAVRLPLEERRDLDRVMAESIRTAGGESIPLGSLLEMHGERPFRELIRRNQRRMISISGNVEGRSLDSVWSEVEGRARALLPGSARVVELGERRAMQRSFRDLGLAMLLAMLLVYMILAAQFESFLDPLIIAAVIPIGLAGSVVAVAASGQTINVLSMIGALALLGIVVNDAIVKVDTIRRLRSEGMEAGAAIERASELRLRPILMTSVTTVLAMVPMAIGLGSGEQLQRPLAITIIGGLSLATLLTLVATPVLYQTAHRIAPPAGDGGAR